MNQNKVVELCERMTKLMADPQHGLATWNIMCEQVVQALKTELCPEPEPTEERIADVALHTIDAMAMMWLRSHHSEIGSGLERIRSTRIDQRLASLEEMRTIVHLDERIRGAR